MAASLTNDSGSAISSISVTGTPVMGTYSLGISGSATAGWLATLSSGDGDTRQSYIVASGTNASLIPGVTITFGATITATDAATIVVRSSSATFSVYTLTSSYQDVSVTDAQAKTILYELREGASATVSWAASGTPGANYATFSENMPLEIQIPEQMDGPPTIYMKVDSGTPVLEVVVTK